ncbi:MAG TPA: glucose 1-dehydrogenase [Azospirillaceae bacterium]|nr:glucose 1-dehydrogenase [Azospirillaceae bacterium]
MAGRVQDKVILITGAASGIGLATAKLCAEQGAKVVMTDRNEAGLRDAAASIPGALALGQDVTLEDRWAEVIAETVSKFGRLDGLVNNAGVGVHKPVEHTTLEEFQFVQRVNVEGVFLGCKHAIGAMKQTGGGSIVNLSSVAGLIGGSNMAAYCASKGAVRIMSKSIAVECAERGLGIRVNSVHPSFLETAMVGALIGGSKDPDKTRRQLERTAALGRMGKAEDAANAILFLLSDESGFMTGSEVVVDGGTTAR